MTRTATNQTRRKLLGGALIFGFGAVTAARAETAIRVGVAQPIFSFLPLDLGMAAGIFARHGVTVAKTVFNGSAWLHQAIAAGSIDIGLGAGPEFRLLAQGAPELAVAAIADLPREMVISVLKDSPIRSVADLKDKRLSVSTKGSLGEWGGQELSRQQGWGTDGIRLVPLGSFAAQIAALKAGRVDGMVVAIATADQLAADGIARTLLSFEKLVRDFHIHVIFAGTSFIQAQPEALRGFLAGWFESVDYMRTHKTEAIAAAGNVLGLSPALASRLYDELLPMYNPTGRFDPLALDTIQGGDLDMGELTVKLDMQKLLTEKFLPDPR